jgi:HK97 family phage portal protein
MSIITRMASALGFEKRANGDGYFEAFGALRTGGTVTPESAQSVAACYAAVAAIAEAIGSLPLHLYKRDGDDRIKAVDHPLYAVLHHAPNGQQSAVELREWLTSCMLLRGNGFCRIVRGNDGQVRELLPLAPERVNVLRKGDTIGGYDYTNRDGIIERLLPAEVFHLRHRAGSDPLIGVSPIEAARAVLDLAIAEGEHGTTTFRNGTRLSGLLKIPGKLNPEQKTQLATSWNSQHAGGGNSGRTAILESGVEFQPLSMSLEDSDFVASRRFSTEEVARIFKIPPVLIGDLSHANFSNSVEMARWFIVHTLGRYMTAWEQAISRQLLTPAGARIYFAEHSADAMLRGDSTGRASFYASGINAGWLKPSEARRLENLPTIEGIDDANVKAATANA